MKEPMVLTLCPTCLQRFYDTGAYIIRREPLLQFSKDSCTYCQVRQGYDYSVEQRRSGKKAEARL